ncbi:MAG: hypothetical protein BKP49_03905 [Treponema sp. CETP13]|nr:MAG: hypothetical protein BKP49_03905 [Treponema sp. CETP13]
MIINIKNNIKSYFAIGLMITAFFAFISCDSDPIFSAIEDEVALDDPNIEGNVYSLVLVGDESNGTLFVQNGNLYSKNVIEERGWVEYSAPASNITYLASDGENLYALSKEDSHDYGTLYYQENATGNWTKVTTVSGDGDVTTLDDDVYNVFDNKETGSTNRNAYITIEDPDDIYDYAVYKISVSGSTVTITRQTDDTYFVATYGDRIVSAARLGTDDYFYDSIGFCAADPDNDGTNTILYKVKDDDTIYYSTDGSNWESGIEATDVDADADEINSILAYGTDLYFATDYGLGVATIDYSDGSLSSSTISSQASTVFDSEGLYGLWEYADTLYASTINDDSTENNYLWGCYDDEWNAE